MYLRWILSYWVKFETHIYEYLIKDLVKIIELVYIGCTLRPLVLEKLQCLFLVLELIS